MFCELWFAKPALGPANGFEFRIGHPAVKHIQGHGLARSRVCLSDEFEERPGDQAGAGMGCHQMKKPDQGKSS